MSHSSSRRSSTFGTPTCSAAETVRHGDHPELERLASSVGGRRRMFGGTAGALPRAAGVLLLFVVWEIASRAGWIDDQTLGAPSSAVLTGWDMIRDGSLPRAMWASTQRVLWALLIGVPAGALLAAIAGSSRTGDAVVDANVQMLRYVPLLAVQPLLILRLGVGESTKIALIALGVAFPVYVNTVAAIRSIDTGHHELADMLGIGVWRRLHRVVIPGAAAGFLVGVRYAMAVAWLLLIVAEQINAHEGLGVLAVRAQAFVRTDEIVVIIGVYAALGVACDVFLRGIERVVLRWRPRR